MLPEVTFGAAGVSTGGLNVLREQAAPPVVVGRDTVRTGTLGLGGLFNAPEPVLARWALFLAADS